MLPEREINRLVNTVLNAVELAAVERPHEGYQSLCEGLRYAEEAGRSGSRWAEELRTRYQDALSNYISRYYSAAQRQPFYTNHRRVA